MNLKVMAKKEVKKYLPDGARVFSTGCWLRYDDKKNCFYFDGIEDNTFYDGESISFDNDERPYL